MVASLFFWLIMANTDKLFTCQVKLNPIDPENSGELSDVIFRKCFFCEKSHEINSEQYFLIQKMSGPGNFYCPFCLRHNLHTKNNRNTLILSFRSIIGYLYFHNYLHSLDRSKLRISEIEDYIFSHEKIGLVNPLFIYDSETMLWFIDFSKVGFSKKKVPLDEVLKTIINILDSFNFSKTVPSLNSDSLFNKYKNAIKLFYTSRRRPENKKILIPTFNGCGVMEPKFFSFDETKDFIFEDLQLK